MVAPGPGDYEIGLDFAHKKLGVILMEHVHSNPNKARQPPGPGRYDPVTKPVLSKFKAAPGVIFTPPRLDRFYKKKEMLTPGPGDYNS